MNAIPLLNCLCCQNEIMIPYLDLGAQPLANNYHRVGESEQVFPLGVQLCPNCYHSQLTVAVDPNLLFKHYLYVSGTSNTLHNYFEWFVRKVESRFSKKKLRVLDIASNDGTLLSIFKAKGHEVQGVDPAENLREYSMKNGVPTIVDYWNKEVASSLEGQYDVIIAMNVLAHISEPANFLRLCRQKLSVDGELYIQTSQAEMFRRFEFDTIYHEHHSFFNTKSFMAIAQRAGLKVTSIEKVPIHGTSYLVKMSHPFLEEDESVVVNLQQEGLDGFYDLKTYQTFESHVKEVAGFMQLSLNSLKKSGYRAIGFGAAAKGNTFLNYAKMELEYVVDENPLKWGLVTPGQQIPVVSLEMLKKIQEPLAILVLAWNFYDEIYAKVKSIRPHVQDVFLQYFPERKLSS